MAETGRRLTDVEITPEMIRAGTEAICLFDPSDDFAVMLPAVFRAMLSAAPFELEATPKTRPHQLTCPDSR